MNWDELLIDTEIAILHRIRADVGAMALPQRLYEEFVKTYKKISTELVIFDECGRVWLTQRPSKERQPDEPFAGQWHNPGVMHNFNESIDKALARLCKDGLGADAVADEPKFIKILEFSESKRGHYLALLYVTRYRCGNLANNAPSGFYNPSDLPQPMFVPHEKLIIPEAVKAAASFGWLQ
jgi:ADP-ribose pyrophosphatase YjhB (NUDIX family)